MLSGRVRLREFCSAFLPGLARPIVRCGVDGLARIMEPEEFMQNQLSQLSDELAGVVERAGKSVVAIYGGGRVPSSGVHWKSGVIVTAEHTLRRDEEIKVGLPDGSVKAAELVGRDPGSDLAVLKFDAGDMPVIQNTGAIEPRTGNIVAAVGRHRDIGVCAAMGIVSVTGPGWNTWRGGHVDVFLRLDLSLCIQDAPVRRLWMCTARRWVSGPRRFRALRQLRFHG